MEKDDNLTKYIIAIIILAAIVIVMIFSGSKEVVEVGDTVRVDYTGRVLDGEIFDTSDQDVAIQADIYQPGRSYEPLEFVVGAGRMIEGFDKGVLGMKVGQKKTLTIPPDQAYGPRDPSRIQVLPLIDNIPATQSIPQTVEVPLSQFNFTFGTDHQVGDVVQLPDSVINMTITSMGDTVNLTYKLSIGDTVDAGQMPWEDTVEAMNSTHITLRHNVEIGDILQFPGTPWNSTVINISAENITVRHNPIPDTQVQTSFGPIQIHFNETAILLDNNPFLAGKTLVFDVEVVEITKGMSTPEP